MRDPCYASQSRIDYIQFRRRPCQRNLHCFGNSDYCIDCRWDGQCNGAKKIGETAILGEKPTSFDIGYINQKTQRYHLADRSNKGVGIFDVKTGTYIGSSTGMVGPVMKKDGTCSNNDKSGPAGVLAAGNEIWTGDGDTPSRFSTPRP
jgi:hypothetical protein